MEAPLPDAETFLRAMARRKLLVLLQRVETKDYRDIAALLAAGGDLRGGLATAMAVFPNIPPCEAVKALTYFEGSDLANLSQERRPLLASHLKEVRKPRTPKIESSVLGA